MPWFPRGGTFQEWPEQAQNLPVGQVIRLYENGFMGAVADPEAKEAVRSRLEHPDGELAAQRFGLADTGAGKLVVPFVHVLEMFPGCWPGKQGQARGDCVSWSTRNALLLTFVCDIVSGKPDEKTGLPEEKPDVPSAGVADGVLSTEAIYWFRGYDGDGWHCPTASEVACKKGGVVLRQKYDDVDLTSYSGRNAGLYGRRAPSGKLAEICSAHLAHQMTELSSFESIRDFLFNGYGVSTCGGEGLANKRDENGVTRRQGSWAHAMAYVGADDRDVIKQKYGGPLVLDLNSWGSDWIGGPRDVFDSASMVPPAKKQLWIERGIVNPSTGNVMIPEGSGWVRYSEMRNRDAQAFGGVNGWPARVLPLDYNPF